jgi:heterodisulfide reductase subunit A-like polyferredoxin
LVRVGVTKAKLLEPLQTSTVKVNPDALVIGAGIAGESHAGSIDAAYEMADAKIKRGAKIVVVDIDPVEHKKNTVRIDLFINADAGKFISSLSKKTKPFDIKDLITRIQKILNNS